MAKKAQQVVYVLVDRYYDEPRKTWARTSLWETFLQSVATPSNISRCIEQISISDLKALKKPKTVRIDSADVVIVNWCAANGDYICGSDDVFLYLQTRGDRRNALLRGGGKLICEFQSGKGVLHQGAYDAIFGKGEVFVLEAKLPPEIVRERDESETFKQRRKREDEKWTNISVKRNKLFRLFHPLTKNLPDSLSSNYKDDRPLFNFDSTAQEDFFAYRHRECAFTGWFDNWRKDWIPLLIADVRSPRPCL